MPNADTADTSTNTAHLAVTAPRVWQNDQALIVSLETDQIEVV